MLRQVDACFRNVIKSTLANWWETNRYVFIIADARDCLRETS
jgi:hypothetical protein